MAQQEKRTAKVLIKYFLDVNYEDSLQDEVQFLSTLLTSLEFSHEHQRHGTWTKENGFDSSRVHKPFLLGDLEQARNQQLLDAVLGASEWGPPRCLPW